MSIIMSNRQKQDGPEAREANLARIRDNQRRSRARRKEYMKECEDKVRMYEQQGVIASKEIQECARDVVNQNRRLRDLLKQCFTKEGTQITDQDIDRHLAVSGDDANNFSNPSATPTASTHLEQLLNRRSMQYESNEYMIRARVNSASGPVSIRRPSGPFAQTPYLQTTPPTLPYHLMTSTPMQPNMQATTSPGSLSNSSFDGLPLTTTTYDAPLSLTMSTQGSVYPPAYAWDFGGFDSNGEELCRDGGDLQGAGALHGIGTSVMPNMGTSGISGNGNGLGYNLTNSFHPIAMSNAFTRPTQLIPS